MSNEHNEETTTEATAETTGTLGEAQGVATIQAWLVYMIEDAGRLMTMVGHWVLEGNTYQPKGIMGDVDMEWLNANAPGPVRPTREGTDPRFVAWSVTPGVPVEHEEVLHTAGEHDLAQIEFTSTSRAMVRISHALTQLERGGFLAKGVERCRFELEEERKAPSDFFKEKGEENLLANIATFELFTEMARRLEAIHAV